MATIRRRGIARGGAATPRGGIIGRAAEQVLDLKSRLANVTQPCLGILFRQRVSNRRRAKVSARARRVHSGSFIITAASVMEMSSPSNARRPVSISNSTTPNAQMSARLSTGLPARLLRTHVRGRAEDHPTLVSSPAS